MKVGDEVVCIKSHRRSNGAQKGNHYVILDIDTCKCGISYNIGLLNPDHDEDFHIGSVCSCCRDMCKEGKVWWHISTRFAPIVSHNFTNKLTAELSKEADKRSVERIERVKEKV